MIGPPPRLEDVPTVTKDDLVLSREQTDAWDHVVKRITLDGFHDVNGCPGYTRAVCSHKAVLRTMRAEDFA